MATPLVDPGMAQNSLSEKQMQSLQREAEASRRAINGGSLDKEKKLRQACEGFESVFIQKMWEGMRASLPKEGLMHSREEQFWQGMYDQELGKSLASAGGVGLADMMVGQLSRNLQNASEVAANRNKRVPMDIAPVPLLPNAAPGTENSAARKADKASGMYEGEAAQPDLPATAPAAIPAGAATENGTGAERGTGGAQANAQTTGQMPGTPPEVLGSLNEFAAQLGVPPVQAMAAANSQAAALAGQTPGQTPGQTAGQGAGQSGIEPGVRTYRPGQKPEQSIDELAAALVAQAGRENGGPVTVTTTRQVNAANRASRDRIVRQRRDVPLVPAGSPVTGRGLAVATPDQGIASQNARQSGQGGQNGQGGQLSTAMAAPTAMRTTAPAARIANTPTAHPANTPASPSANSQIYSPASANTNSQASADAGPAAGPASGPASGPAALRTSVEGLGLSGSELASNTAAARGHQSRRPAGSADE